MKQTKQSLSFIRKNFLTSLKDLKKIKLYFLFSLILFFFVSFIGLTLPIFFEEQILKLIEELIKQTQDLGFFEIIWFIILNNAKSAFFGIILGIFLGIFPIAVIILNAYILGFVANKSIVVGGFFVLWRLLPHGIFEIPAILISTALGIRLGIGLMKNCIFYYNKKAKEIEVAILILLSLLFLPISFIIYFILTFKEAKLRNGFFDNFLLSMRIFIFIVIPLLVIAGIIEGSLIWLVG